MSPSDRSWADVGRKCAAAEPVWEPSLDSIARQLERGRDTHSAAIARESPGGFAGVYREGSQLVVLLTDTLQKATALPAIARSMSRRFPRRDLEIEQARVVQARWSFTQLHDWWAYLWSRRVGFAGATMFDIDERDNRLVFGFQDSTSIRAAEQKTKRLELPCYLIAFEVQPPVSIR